MTALRFLALLACGAPREVLEKAYGEASRGSSAAGVAATARSVGLAAAFGRFLGSRPGPVDDDARRAVASGLLAEERTRASLGLLGDMARLAGTEAIAVKGSALAIAGLSHGEREFSDVDLLIPERDLGEWIGAAREAGAQVEPCHEAHELGYARRGQAMVELHAALPAAIGKDRGPGYDEVCARASEAAPGYSGVRPVLGRAAREIAVHHFVFHHGGDPAHAFRVLQDLARLGDSGEGLRWGAHEPGSALAHLSMLVSALKCGTETPQVTEFLRRFSDVRNLEASPSSDFADVVDRWLALRNEAGEGRLSFILGRLFPSGLPLRQRVARPVRLAGRYLEGSARRSRNSRQRLARWRQLLGAGLVALAAVAACPATAQQVAFQREVSLREKIRQDMSRARFRLGPLRLIPVLRLSNLGYTNNATGSAETEAKPDYTASVQAGMAFVFPIGHDVFLFGEEAPGYYWYAHQVDLRHFGGRYNGSAAAFLNRLTLVANAGYQRVTSLYSSELLQPVDQETRDARLALELEIFERLALLASGDGAISRNHGGNAGDSGFQTLDNDKLAARGGIRYRFRGRLDVSAQVEKTRQTFRYEAPQRDNQTTAYLLGLGYDRPKMYINASAGYRQGEAFNGSSYPTYHGVTGGGFVSYLPNRRLELNLGGSRNLVNSLFAGNPYYVETLGHAGFGVQIGHRMTIGPFGELSTLDYPLADPIDETGTRRRDRGVTVGGNFGLQLFRSTGLTVRAARTRFTSNVPGFDRTVLSVTGGLSLDAFLPRQLQETQ